MEADECIAIGETGRWLQECVWWEESLVEDGLRVEVNEPGCHWSRLTFRRVPWLLVASLGGVSLWLPYHPLLAHWPVFWKDSTRCSAVIIFDRSSCCCLGGMKMENTGRADVERLSAVKASCKRRTGWMGGGFRESGSNNMEVTLLNYYSLNHKHFPKSIFYITHNS